jgi:MoxR-like ATPase
LTTSDAWGQIVTPNTAPTTTALQDKFTALHEALNTELIERGDVIDTMLLAILSRTHHFQLGTPGVAKSYSIRALESHVSDFPKGGSFEILLTRFSAMEEMWGPYDLRALEDGRYRRNTDGMAPDAVFWFIDEIFKSSSSLLNSFLWAINERQFRNDAQVVNIPLWSMFCASNELPESEELNALYDRIHLRVITKSIQEPGAFVRMLNERKVALHGTKNEKILAWSDIEAAYEEVSQVQIPTDVIEALQTVRQQLRDEGVEPTDRRFVESLRVIKAAAWLDGTMLAGIDHVRPLQHMLWDTPEELPKVQRIMLELANPLDKRAIELLEIVEKMQSELDKLLSDDVDVQLKNKRGVELHNRVERVTKDLHTLTAEIEASGRKSQKVEEVRSKLVTVARKLLKEMFNIDADPNI